MQVYAEFDASGLPLGFYSDEIFPDLVIYGPPPDPTPDDPAPVAPEVSRSRNPTIPAGAITVTDAQWHEMLANPGRRRWDGTAVVVYLPPVPPIDLNAYAAAAHLARRDGGVTIGSMLVKTDSESRSLITGAYALSEVRPDAKMDFKAASGWITLDAAAMQTIAVAVGTWVQACYSTYRAVGAGIAGGSITTPAQIDAAFAAVTLPG